EPWPVTVPMSKRSLSSRNSSACRSITVISFFSLERFSATAEPTCPAPKMIIFTALLAIVACVSGRGKNHRGGPPVVKAVRQRLHPLGLIVVGYLPVPLGVGQENAEFVMHSLAAK